MIGNIAVDSDLGLSQCNLNGSECSCSPCRSGTYHCCSVLGTAADWFYRVARNLEDSTSSCPEPAVAEMEISSSSGVAARAQVAGIDSADDFVDGAEMWIF